MHTRSHRRSDYIGNKVPIHHRRPMIFPTREHCIGCCNSLFSSACVYTPVYLHSARRLKTSSTPQGLHCRICCGIIRRRRRRRRRRPERVYSPCRPSVLGPWRSSPRCSRDRSTNGRGEQGKPHCLLGAPCALVKATFPPSAFPYKLSHCPPFDISCIVAYLVSLPFPPPMALTIPYARTSFDVRAPDRGHTARGVAAGEPGVSNPCPERPQSPAKCHNVPFITRALPFANR
jgi:hypothetical protein